MLRVPFLILILVPYLGAYLITWLFDLDISLLLKVFWGLHLISIVMTVRLIWYYGDQIKPSDLLVACVLLLLFLVPGAYLEYPSDTWEHFRRIFRWSELGAIESYPDNSKYKFAYFWNYSILCLFNLELRRIALDFCSAFWQLATCYQVYRLSKSLNCSRALSYLNIFGFIALFGTNVFNLRYYALSSTPLAYIVYIEIIIIALQALRRENLYLLWHIPILCVAIYFNHIQELLFLPLVLLPILLLHFDEKLGDRSRTLYRASIATLIFVGFALGYYLVHYFPEVYANLTPGQVGRFGHLRIWNLDFKYYQETIGVAGLIGIILSILFFSKNKLFFALSLAPVFSLIYPPSVAVYAKLINTPYLTYRILYAVPLSFGFIGGLYYFFHYLSNYIKIFKLEWVKVFSASILLIGLSLSSDFPYRGKLFFQIYRVPAERELLALDQTAFWFMKNRDIAKLRHCWILTDNATRTLLATHLGMNEYYYGGEAIRRARILPAREFMTTESILSFAEGKEDFCGVLVGIKEKLPVFSPSLVAQASGHWPEDIGDPRWLISDEFVNASSALVGKGWTRTFVPPCFYLYEN
jgi:hypothetical protein